MWSPVVFYYQSSIETFEASSTASGYDVDNLKNGFETEIWKATSAQSQKIYTDAGTGNVIELDFLVFGAHNLKTAGATAAFGYSSWPLTGDWAQVASGGYIKYGHCAAVVGSNMYVFGGLTGYSPSSYVTDFRRYNTVTNVWTSCTSGATTRAAGTLTAIGTDLWLFGGYTTVGSTPADLWKYDTLTRAWTLVTSSPTGGRYAHAACTLGGELWIHGGQTTGSTSAYTSLMRYNPSSNTWTTVTCSIPYRSSHVMVAIGDCIFVHAGWNGVTSGTCELWRWNVTSSLVTTMTANSNYITYSHAGVAVNSHMYVFGGKNGTNFQTMWRYSPSSNSWTRVASASSGRYDHTMVAVGDLMVAHGGILYPSSNRANDTWTTTGKRIAIPDSGEVTYVSSRITPDDDDITLITYATSNYARVWFLEINGPGTTPYMGFLNFGMKTELGYLNVDTDPHNRTKKANVNISDTGFLLGVWERYTERQVDFSFPSAQDSLYNAVSEWFDTCGMRNFVMQWEPTSHSGDVWVVHADPSLSAPMHAGGAYRNIKFSVRGRKP